jgi:hypothetical protein
MHDTYDVNGVLKALKHQINLTSSRFDLLLSQDSTEVHEWIYEGADKSLAL